MLFRSATPSVMPTGLTWLLIILAVTAVLMVLFRRHLRPSRLGSYAVLGVVAAIVTNLQGDWTWLSLMQEIRAGSPIQYSALACVAAVLVGATLTAVSRRRFKFVRPDPKVMLREATGGGLMAAGAILIPGGNDSLLVYGVPSGSPNALAAYFVMFALMLAVLRIDPVFRRWAGWTGTKS